MTAQHFEHEPDHPVGTQPGPHGLYAWWCKRDDCEWRETTGPGRVRSAYLVADPEDAA